MSPDRRYGFPAKVRLQLSGRAGRQPLVGRMWLFGSRGRGDHRPDSDLDVAIELICQRTLPALTGCILQPRCGCTTPKAGPKSCKR